jgi:hypothetical protein
MPSFRLRRDEFGAMLREITITEGFTVKPTNDAAITVGVPVITDDTQAQTTTSGDGKIELTN